MSEQAEVESLAELAGIFSSYHDQTGRLVETSFAARRAALAALGFPTRSASDRAHARERLTALRTAPIARVLACAAETPIAIALNGNPRGRGEWALTTETGETCAGATQGAHHRLDLPALAPGYHRLTLQLDGQSYESLLVAAPARCWQPSELAAGRRGFGFTAQIYGLRSPRQFGVGDYSDVADLAVGAARCGASFLGLSPAHALFPSDPSRFSPYSPSSRLFLQTSLIDPSAIAERAPQAIAERLASDDLAARLHELREAALLDYEKIWALKHDLFEGLWAAFGDARDEAFLRFRGERGEPLEQHATFDALSERFAAQGALSMARWPQAYRDAASAEVAQFRRENAERVAFHAWLQWIADRQFANAHGRARQAGMSLGLYRDLAVGADREGSEVWGAPTRYLHDASVGAPPDPLGPQGQNWGLPPFDPLALEDKDLRPFRDLVSANMRHAGALRIDHAFQLRRLFLIPSGSRPADGAYVAYPLEALLGVLRIESHRARCLVIAEDLGTAPRGFSDAIMRAGVLSYRLLSFERDAAGGFLPPRDFPREALAAASTHDLPTFRGWWRALDADLRECFGFFDSEQASEERRARAGDRRRLLDAFKSERLARGPAERESDPPWESCLRFLARTPCALAAVQVEDAIGETQQANLPGPSNGHPNWRRRLSQPVEAIAAPGGPLARAAAALAREGRGLDEPLRRLAAPAPRATYRLQFNKDFTFEAAIALAPYLQALGVSHVYASPITKAAAGSMHGYDVNDYNEINPELGGMAGFLRFSDALLAHGLGLIVDFVPNHMGVAGPGNAWWLSVLEWGEASPHAATFDIDFRRPGANGKILLPALGRPYVQALENGEIALSFDPDAGAFAFSYFDQSFPLRPDLYPELLRGVAGAARATAPALERLIEDFEALAAARGDALLAACDECKAALAKAAQTPPLRRALVGVAANFAADREDGRRALHDMLARQHYRLGYWRLASSELNYRRFFDISTLAGVRVEDPRVFARVHALLFALARQGRIQGVRLDHIDGLADPAAYLDCLQSELGPGFYVVAEKILERGESLRDWPIAGATGYDSLAALDQIFVDGDNADAFDTLYREETDDRAPYDEQLVAIKSALLTASFGSEFATLAQGFGDLARSAPVSLDLDDARLRSALAGLIACFPAYRSYIGEHGPDADDLALLTRAAARARARLGEADCAALAFILETLETSDPDPGRRRLTVRFQQLTGPLMAKSAEDTLFYRYGRLIALNEVGADPARFGAPASAFHAAMSERAKRWPAALTATGTHDVKRGEDARARLLAATSAPALWRDGLALFKEELAALDKTLDARAAYLLFQSILGALPIALLESPDDHREQEAFLRRTQEFVTKALREAKLGTSWTDPRQSYESVAQEAVACLLAKGRFLPRIANIARELARRGAQISIARAVLKCAAPGVPDIYQGAEFWDFSYVDPDNRRPVDYAARREALAAGGAPADLLRDWRDGRVKQAVIARMLADRAANPDLYALGDYRALDLSGRNDRRFIAFERRRGADVLVAAAATRFFGPDWRAAGEPARLSLAPGAWRNLLDGEAFQSTGSLALEETLGPWPALILRKAL